MRPEPRDSHPTQAQQAIVAEIEAEQALVAVNHELIRRLEKKIEEAIARIWDSDQDAADA